jgi:hypothetical protein
MGGTCCTHGIQEKCIENFRLRQRWEGVIKVGLKEIDFEGWTGFIWFRIWG